ncbi:MAG TPA: AsmA-like C-terminal region-containing protein, partial [Terriglobia bacterium]|nr:AsmA-like C-terminal region-containing protein [Terriglobia bacterium]
ESDIRVSSGQAQLNNLRFNFYDGKGKGKIVLNLGGPNMAYHGQTQLSGVDMAKLLAGFPSMRGAMTGTLETQMTFSGVSASSPDPWAGKDAQGVTTIRKGRWPKLQLNKTLLQLAHVAQLGAASGDPSAFSSITVQWQLAHDVMTAKSVRIVGTGITVDGSGTVNLAGPGALHYEGVAEIEAKQNPLTNILADLSGATFQNGKLHMPFVVNGTLDKPLFQLKANSRFNPPAAAKPGSKQNPTPQTIQDLFKLLKPKKK